MRSTRPLLLAMLLIVPGAAAASFTVTATDFAWTPNFFVAVVGDSVTWTNGGGFHNVRFDLGPVRSLPWTQALATTGVKNFFCTIHGGAMQGNIRVLPFSGPDLVVQLVPGAASTNPTQASFRVDWQNQGNQATGAATTILLEYADPAGARQTLASIPVGSMNAGGASAQQVTWNDGRLRAGSFQVFATIDAGGAIAEVDEANNGASGNVVFLSPLVPRQQV